MSALIHLSDDENEVLFDLVTEASKSLDSGDYADAVESIREKSQRQL